MKQVDVEGMLKDLMYEVTLEVVTGRRAKFVKDLNAQFRIKKALTPLQEHALRKIYREVL